MKPARHASSKRQLAKADYVALSSFRYALRRFLRFSEDAAAKAGLSTQQHQALLAIRGYPDSDWITVGQLAERLQIRHHSAVGLLDRLIAADLVVRSPHPEDRRKVVVQLTAGGESVLETLSTAHRAELRRVGPGLLSALQALVPGENA